MSQKAKGMAQAYVEETKRNMKAPVGNGQHIHREFFSAHQVPVIHICFVENGP